jgi:hypothetical protein
MDQNLLVGILKRVGESKRGIKICDANDAKTNHEV